MNEKDPIALEIRQVNSAVSKHALQENLLPLTLVSCEKSNKKFLRILQFY